MNVRILAFSGSLREKSFNKKLLAIAAEGAKAAGAEVEIIDLKDFDAPVYNGDFEEQNGIPPQIHEFVKHVTAADGLLISSPEHNASITAALKNTIDWASRDRVGPEKQFCFHHKPIAILGASPGGHGASRGLESLKAILGNVGGDVLDTHMALGKVADAFHEDGRLHDQNHDDEARAIGAGLYHAILAARDNNAETA